jgi:flagellin-specific chaperone FliS
MREIVMMSMERVVDFWERCMIFISNVWYILNNEKLEKRKKIIMRLSWWVDKFEVISWNLIEEWFDMHLFNLKKWEY